MPRPGLSSRLKHLRLSRDIPSGTEMSCTEQTNVPEQNIPGFSRIGEYVYQRTSVFPVPDLTGPLSGLFLPVGTDPDSLVFFDLETTGLSSGAGTIAFLAGFGRYSGENLVVDQFFLSDFPGEGEFLEILQNSLPETGRLVSYNGRAFDEKLLISRGLMRGMHFRYSGHSDLLYASRRLWKKRIGSCRLGNIEELILKISRTEDLPGAEVPERWFGFLKNGDASLLQEVFSHHQQDIVSLAFLLVHMEEILKFPLRAEGVDKRALGVWLLGREDFRGEELLSRAEGEGDYTAGVLLAFARKRRGDLNGAVYIWHNLAEKRDTPLICEELSKYYEHTLKQVEVALLWARRGLASVSGENGERHRRQFLHRLNRLENKHT